MMRRSMKKDSQSIAFPAGFIAGLTFYFYRSNTIALYVMWKSLQVFNKLSLLPNSKDVRMHEIYK